MKTTITLTKKTSDAIAIDALPRLEFLAMASMHLSQTEQQVKVGMTVTHKSQGDDSTELRGSIALRGCGVAPSVARYPRNWASSLRELSAFAVCSVSFV